MDCVANHQAATNRLSRRDCRDYAEIQKQSRHTEASAKSGVAVPMPRLPRFSGRFGHSRACAPAYTHYDWKNLGNLGGVAITDCQTTT